MGRKAGNPYKVLYWMGAALLLLLLGVAILVLRMPREPAAPPDPERTLLYIYDKEHPANATVAVVIEESRSHQTLTAVAFSASAEAAAAYQRTGSRAAQETLAAALRHKLHHRVFLPYPIISDLVDAASGVAVEGYSYTGPQAIAYILADPDQSPRRAALVMLSLADSVTRRGVEMGLSEGLAMARQVDSDLDLTAIPDILGRWSQYASPHVETVAGNDPAASGMLLTPDPTGK